MSRLTQIDAIDHHAQQDRHPVGDISDNVKQRKQTRMAGRRRNQIHQGRAADENGAVSIAGYHQPRRRQPQECHWIAAANTTAASTCARQPNNSE